MNQLIKICLLSIVLCISCSKKSIVSKTETHTTEKDSTSVKYITRLDTITIPGDTIQTTFTVECDSVTNKPKPVVFQSSSAHSIQNISIDKNGILKAQTINAEQKKIIEIQDKEIYTLKQQLKSQSSDVSSVIQKKVIPKWVWYSLGLNACLLAYVFRKPALNLLKLALKFII